MVTPSTTGVCLTALQAAHPQVAVLAVALGRPDAVRCLVRAQGSAVRYAVAIDAPPAPGDLAAFRRSRTYTDVLQDWPTWMQNGLIDLNVLMNYKRDAVGEQGVWFDGWNAFARGVPARSDGLSAGVAAGTATVALDLAAVHRAFGLAAEPDPREPRYLHTVRGEGYVLRPDS